MKKTKIIYWITTSIICLFASTAIFMNSQMAIDGATHLGVPRWLGLEVSIGQLLGLVLLIVPAVPAKVKEWAYVGFGITYISAFIAHLVVDGYTSTWGPALAFTLLSVSYVYFHKLQDNKK